MAIALTSEHHPHVLIDGHDVLIDDFRESDPEVVALVRDADDPERVLHQCLGVGARALRVAGVSADAAIVEREFGKLQSAFDAKLGETLSQVGGVAERLLGEDDGELSKLLAANTAQLEAMLGETFDPDSKRSVLSKFEQAFNTLAAAQLKTLRQAVDPDDESSSLGRLRRDLLKVFNEQSEAHTKAVGEWRSGLQPARTTAEVIDLTTIKGRRFEEVVLALTATHRSAAW